MRYSIAVVLTGLGLPAGAAQAAPLVGIFLADANNGQGQVPYQTDGTTAGTIKIPLPARTNTTYAFWPLTSSIAISSYDDSTNVYAIDFIGRYGTVTSWTGCPGCILQRYHLLGANLYFVGTDNSAGVNILYRSSGTVAGTKAVCTLDKPCGVVDPTSTLDTVFTYKGKDYVVFSAYGGKTYVYSVGATSLTLAYSYSNPQQTNPLNWDSPAGDQIIFSNVTSSQGAELWATDGTAAGRHLVKSFYPGQTDGMPQNPTVSSQALTVNGKVLLIATDPYNGTALWVTDGTSAGTKRLQIGKDDAYRIYQNYGTFAQFVGSKLYYLESNYGTPRFSGFGQSLYVLDVDVGGAPRLVKWTYQNTHMMIMPGADMTITPAGWIYTTALQVGIAGCQISGSDFVGTKCDDKLYRLNVASGQVQLVANPKTTYEAACESTCDGIMHLTATGNSVLFSASDKGYRPPNSPSGSRELSNAQPWFSKGTAATTAKLKDIAPVFVGGSMPYQFVAMPAP